MTEEKNKGGRPTKLTEHLIEVFEQVVNEYVLACTDEDIFIVLNDRLKPKERICYTTFKVWKSKQNQSIIGEDSEIFEKFLSVIKKALLLEKKNCLKKLEEGKSGEWQKYAWIIERKFKEWNLRQITEADVVLTDKKSTPLTKEQELIIARAIKADKKKKQNND